MLIYMVIYADLCWFMVIYSDLCWFIWWFIVIYGDLCWFMHIYSDLCWFMVIYADLCWFIVITLWLTLTKNYGKSPCLRGKHPLSRLGHVQVRELWQSWSKGRVYGSSHSLHGLEPCSSHPLEPRGTRNQEVLLGMKRQRGHGSLRCAPCCRFWDVPNASSAFGKWCGWCCGWKIGKKNII